MNGPVEVSFGSTPTFFCMRSFVSCLIPTAYTSAMTHACCLDMASDIDKELFVRFGIFSSNQDMERDLSALQRFQMLGWVVLAFCVGLWSFRRSIIPFFAVVTMNRPSKVRRKRVAGNS